MAAKTERFGVRPTAEVDALIRRPTEVEGTDRTASSATATLAHARGVLAARQLSMRDAQRLVLANDGRALRGPQR